MARWCSQSDVSEGVSVPVEIFDYLLHRARPGHRRLQLNFQACIDVAGSESGTEELECLATWSEGSKHYLVAEMDREHVFSDESKYRCFVYTKAGKGDNRTVKMAQSLAATCTGLWSPVEGYRTFWQAAGVSLVNNLLTH